MTKNENVFILFQDMSALWTITLLLIYSIEFCCILRLHVMVKKSLTFKSQVLFWTNSFANSYGNLPF